MTVLAERETGNRAAIAIDGLRAGYARDALPVIDGLSLTVAPGSFHAVLGPSGCGKSTLLKTLARILAPAAGHLDLPREVAYVPQGSGCFPWLTVEENVAYGLWARGAPRRERLATARRLLERVGLGDSAGAWPHQLSEGMRQRVSIARAFAVDAPLLLMDEPFSALDFQTKVAVQDELLALWRERGATVLYVTHDIDEALTLADHVSVLSRRPARVVGGFEVPFPRPRSYRHIRAESRYGELFARAYDLLECGDETGSGP